MQKYNPEIGFQLSIDCITKNTFNGDFLIPFYYLNPPANMILKNNFDQDAKYNCLFDLDSPIDTPKYLEGY